ncbi:MAG: 7-cyano-7-deazaguanine synthase [Promethearchaeota archaeon]|jgi:7-cyano-7-deazaguanine synthase
MRNKKLALTGANGYLGKHTIKNAIKRGWQVVGIVRREDAAKELELLGADTVIIKNFTLESLKKAIIGCKAVIHFRGVVCGSSDIFDEVNIEGTRILVEAASEMKITRLIFPSGLGVDRYGIADWANNNYFHSKLRAEQIIEQGKVPYIIFRPSYILGYDDELIPEIITQIGGQIVSVVGSGTIPMQPIFIEDAVEAFLAAAEGLGQDNMIYDLVGPEITDMIELIEKVFEKMKELGFHVPPPQIHHLSYENAPKALDICKERVDVMRCNVTSDGNIAAKSLDYRLSSLDKAIKAAVIVKMFPESKGMNERAILLLSGGIDSATALYWAYDQGYEILALSLNYRYRPEKEKKAVLKLSQKLGVKVIEIPIDYMQEAVELRIEGKLIPSAVHAPEGFIPSRNLVFYSIAAYHAEIHGCKFIIGGHMGSDPRKFPDASPNFFKSLEKLINKGKHSRDTAIIEILLPLMKMNKIDVLRLAIKLDVPLNLTWSCYNDEAKPCGRCSSCNKRRDAFLSLNYPDPECSL